MFLYIRRVIDPLSACLHINPSFASALSPTLPCAVQYDYSIKYCICLWKGLSQLGRIDILATTHPVQRLSNTLLIRNETSQKR
jgi:hypothetical protein